MLILGALLVPAGIIAFFTLQNIGGFLNTLLAFIFLAGAVWGVYLLIIQCASIGDILKKHNDKAYYKNIVFYNLLKQKPGNIPVLGERDWGSRIVVSEDNFNTLSGAAISIPK